MSSQSKADKNELIKTILTGLIIMGALLTIVPSAIQTTVWYWQTGSLNETKHYQIGLNYEVKGDYDNAAKSFRKEIEINPDNAAAYNELAWLYVDKLDTNYDEAIELARKAITLAEQEQDLGLEYRLANYLDTLGWAYYKKGEYTKSIAALERAIDLDSQEGYKAHLYTAIMALKASATPTPIIAP